MQSFTTKVNNFVVYAEHSEESVHKQPKLTSGYAASYDKWHQKQEIKLPQKL